MYFGNVEQKVTENSNSGYDALRGHRLLSKNSSFWSGISPHKLVRKTETLSK